MNQIRHSVVILSLNKLDYTRICLESLFETTTPNWELIVIDNGSTDGSAEWLDKFQRRSTASGVPCRILHNDRNVGCSTARNQGLAATSGTFVTFCDNDVALRTRNWLGTLEAVFDRFPETGIVGPKIVYPFEPYPIQCAGVAVSPSGRVQFRGRGEAREIPQWNRPEPVQALISACCMARKDVLVGVGGFDEIYNPVEYEDIDLCYKVRAKGYAVRYEPSAEIYHFENVTTEGTPALPNTYLIVRHGMIFKQRWQLMFSNENGPLDADCRWRNIVPRRLSDIGDLPTQ